MVMDAHSARVQRLAEGFHALLDEYNNLLSRTVLLEDAAAQAKSQFERFVVERGTVGKDDLKDLEFRRGTGDIEDPDRRQIKNEKWWMRSDLPMSKRNILRTRYAVDALPGLGMDTAGDGDAHSKISSEVMQNGSSAMPSISESPLELDFTVPGTPSRLDCPFASMSNRRLSAHAASVMSRYRPGSMTPRSSMSRANGIAPATVTRTSALANGVTKEEFPSTTKTSGQPGRATSELEASIQGSAPQCPIRFLDKNSPEEVANYFEKHKHELPRSHEICVKRYQGDERSVRELDAKYGNLVSMIQGLGQKHAPMLPGKIDDHHDEDGDSGQSAESAERVRQWASRVHDVDDGRDADKQAADEGRLSHFDRPLKDVRVGESPSRPWGIPVPISIIEKSEQQQQQQQQDADKARASPQGMQESQAETAQPPRGCPFASGASPGMLNPHLTEAGHPGNRPEIAPPNEAKPAPTTTKPAGKCPFSSGAPPGMMNPHTANEVQRKREPTSVEAPAVFLQSAGGGKDAPGLDAGLTATQAPGNMTFSGPVFIGYSAEQAAAVIEALRLKG